MTATQDAEISKYVNALEKKLRRLEYSQRREILDEIQDHISSLRTEEPELSASEIIARVGNPEDIATEALSRFEVQDDLQTNDLAALALFAFAGFIVPLAYFAGLILIWRSSAFSRREKKIAALASAVFPAIMFVVLATLSNPFNLVWLIYGQFAPLAGALVIYFTRLRNGDK